MKISKKCEKNKEFTEVLEKSDVWSRNFRLLKMSKYGKHINDFEEMIKISRKLEKIND